MFCFFCIKSKLHATQNSYDKDKNLINSSIRKQQILFYKKEPTQEFNPKGGGSGGGGSKRACWSRDCLPFASQLEGS